MNGVPLQMGSRNFGSRGRAFLKRLAARAMRRAWRRVGDRAPARRAYRGVP